MREEVRSYWSHGDRTTFGVEFSMLRSMPAPFGYLRLWIGGNPIGRPDDPVFVYPVLTDLEWVCKQPLDREFSERLITCDPRDAWTLLQRDGGKYRLSPIEFFDDYEIFAVRGERLVRFMWNKTTDNESESSQPIDAIISHAQVVDVVEHLRGMFDEVRAASSQQSH